MRPRAPWQRVVLIVFLPLWGPAWLFCGALYLIAIAVAWCAEDLWMWAGDLGGGRDQWDD